MQTFCIAVRLGNHIKLWMIWLAHFPHTLFPSTFRAATSKHLRQTLAEFTKLNQLHNKGISTDFQLDVRKIEVIGIYISKSHSFKRQARVNLLCAVRLNPVEILLRTEEKIEVHSKKMNRFLFLFFKFRLVHICRI